MEPLIDSIRTGKTGTELAGAGQERFEVIAKNNQAELFNEGMVSLTRVVRADLLSVYDFSGIGTLMDVGGGVGELMVAILRKYPSMRGLVFDLPHCAEDANKNLGDSGFADRCQFIGGNFFESVTSGADAILMKSILHDWNDDRCLLILRLCREALKPGARLIVVDRILPDKIEPRADHLATVLSDINMLRGPGGRERTETEQRELLTSAGFRLTRIVPAGRVNVLEASRN